MMLEHLIEPWAAFFGLVILLFTIDLLFGSRGGNLRAALLWSAIWVGAGLAFGLWIWSFQGGEVAAAYFVACKMLLTGIVEIPVVASLGVIVGIVLIAIAASWAFPRQEQAR